MSWTDTTGRQWRVSFSHGTLPRMRAAGIDLLEPETILAKLQSSAAELLIEVYRPHWKAAGLSQSQFAELLAGSLTEATSDFKQRFAAFLDREGYENYARLIRGRVGIVERLKRAVGSVVA